MRALAELIRLSQLGKLSVRRIDLFYFIISQNKNFMHKLLVAYVRSCVVNNLLYNRQCVTNF